MSSGAGTDPAALLIEYNSMPRSHSMAHAVESLAKEIWLLGVSVEKYAFFKNTSPTCQTHTSTDAINPEMKEPHTSHSVLVPMVPGCIPAVHAPVGLLRSTGNNARSLGSMENDAFPNESARLAFVVHGTVHCWVSHAPPTIVMMAWVSAAGAMMSVVPVSRIAVRPVKPESCPLTVIAFMAPSQNPCWLTLGKVTRVLAMNLVESSPPKVISPSLS